MSNEQLGAFILANAVTIALFTRWVVNRAIDYTHLQRDVRELQGFEKAQELKNEQTLKDLKGLSIKIDKKSSQ
jgi:uncharacterized membrane protein (DUF106 family)